MLTERERNMQRQMEESRIREVRIRGKQDKRSTIASTDVRKSRYLLKKNIDSISVEQRVRALIRLRCGNMWSKVNTEKNCKM